MGERLLQVGPHLPLLSIDVPSQQSGPNDSRERGSIARGDGDLQSFILTRLTQACSRIDMQDLNLL